MVVYLIAPSNYFLMPYIDNYIQVLKRNHIDYKIILWDRLNINEKLNKSLFYKNKESGLSKNTLQYLKYFIFVKRNLKISPNDKVIIFSLQLLPLIKILKCENYIIDIRDHHPIIKIKYFKSILENAKLLIISSEKYKNFLNHRKILVNHNFNLNSHIIKKNDFKSAKIKVATIGAIRDLKENKKLINLLKNNKSFLVCFHGQGDAVEPLQKFVEEQEIKNVYFTGKYGREEEEDHYMNSDLISIIRDNSTFNNQIALPNRLYKAVKYNTPVVTSPGSYLSDIVEKYKLGVIVDYTQPPETFKEETLKFLHDSSLIRRQEAFLNQVIAENTKFEEELLNFVEV